MLTEVSVLLRDPPAPPPTQARKREEPKWMEEAAGGRQEGRAGRRSRVGLTPVSTGWEAALGTMPGKECRGRTSSQLPELACFVQGGGEGGPASSGL